MNVDQILSVLNHHGVDYLLIGGVNFMLHHEPDLTFDVDVWVEDIAGNLRKLNVALRELGAEWGSSEKEWRPVPADFAWLQEQACFCLTTRHGALDVFREVCGLESRYSKCRNASRRSATATGVPFRGLSDEDMLRSQKALPPGEQSAKRIQILKTAIAQKKR